MVAHSTFEPAALVRHEKAGVVIETICHTPQQALRELYRLAEEPDVQIKGVFWREDGSVLISAAFLPDFLDYETHIALDVLEGLWVAQMRTSVAQSNRRLALGVAALVALYGAWGAAADVYAAFAAGGGAMTKAALVGALVIALIAIGLLIDGLRRAASWLRVTAWRKSAGRRAASRLASFSQRVRDFLDRFSGDVF